MGNCCDVAMHIRRATLWACLASSTLAAPPHAFEGGEQEEIVQRRVGGWEEAKEQQSQHRTLEGLGGKYEKHHQQQPPQRDDGAKARRDLVASPPGTGAFNGSAVQSFDSLVAWTEWSRASGKHLPLPIVRLSRDAILTSGAQEEVATVPLFLVIGAQKGGTTNLRNNLLGHPQLEGAREEVAALVSGPAALDFEFSIGAATWVPRQQQQHQRWLRMAAEGRGLEEEDEEDEEDEAHHRHQPYRLTSPSEQPAEEDVWGGGGRRSLQIAEKRFEAPPARADPGPVLKELSHSMFNRTVFPFPKRPKTRLSKEEALKVQESVTRGDSFLFVACPKMAWRPATPYTVKSLFPNIKMVLVVRDPVERYFSAFRMAVCKLNFKYIDKRFHRPGNVGEYISKALDQYLPYHPSCVGPSATASDLKRCWRRAEKFDPLTRGLYAEQLERYFSLFEPSQVLVVDSDRLFSHFEQELSAVAAFLGLEEFDFQYVEQKHQAGGDGKSCEKRLRERARAVEEMTSHDARCALWDYYRPHNERFFALLGVDFGWNDTPPHGEEEEQGEGPNWWGWSDVD